MRLEQLEVYRLRGISGAVLEPARHINWIVGGNAAGKTTLLEAIFLLARGRSFRGGRYGGLVQHGEREALVRTDVRAGERRRRIGVAKSAQGLTWWENGARRGALEELGVRLQVRMVGENAQRLIEGGPDLRRWFVDWNLFHVEPRYGEVLGDWKRVHGQRNAWLATGGRGRAVWDAPYVALSEELTRFRGQFVSALNGQVQGLAPLVGLGGRLDVSLGRGWPEGENLADRLEVSREQDVARGFTWYGPGRADLDVRVEGERWLGSRGENKRIVVILQLGAQRLWSERGCECIWLLDDLGAELSRETLTGIWGEVAKGGAQVFATALETPPFPGRLFHVEHGQVRCAT